MKKVFLFVILIFVVSFSYAQRKYDAKLITVDNDTIQATLTKDGCNDINHWLGKVYIDGKKVNLALQKKKYKRLLIKLAGTNFIYDLKKTKLEIIKLNLFIKLLVDGRIKLYYYKTDVCSKNEFKNGSFFDGKKWRSGASFSRTKPYEAYYIEYNGILKKIKKKAFKKHPEKYLPNAPKHLIQKIKTKNVFYRGIVVDYNKYFEEKAAENSE